MHRLTELAARSVNFSLSVLNEANDKITEALQTSAATPLVKNRQMIQLQKAITAVGVFSMFEAMLQDGLQCADGFAEANNILRAANQSVLAEKFSDYQKAINVLKHGKGRSYEALVAKASHLPFRVKLPTESFFFEGDVSEIPTLIEVDDQFVRQCAQVISDVSEAIRAVRNDFYF
jgi:hypothetical protein